MSLRHSRIAFVTAFLVSVAPSIGSAANLCSVSINGGFIDRVSSVNYIQKMKQRLRNADGPAWAGLLEKDYYELRSFDSLVEPAIANGGLGVFLIAADEILAERNISPLLQLDFNWELALEAKYKGTVGEHISAMTAVLIANPKMSGADLVSILGIANGNGEYSVSKVLEEVPSSLLRRLSVEEFKAIDRMALSNEARGRLYKGAKKNVSDSSERTAQDEIETMRRQLEFKVGSVPQHLVRPVLFRNLWEKDRLYRPTLERQLLEHKLTLEQIEELVKMPRYPFVGEALEEAMNLSIESSGWKAAIAMIPRLESAGIANEIRASNAKMNRFLMVSTVFERIQSRLTNDELIAFIENYRDDELTFTHLISLIPDSRVAKMSAEEHGQIVTVWLTSLRANGKYPSESARIAFRRFFR
jgi:hypothetical protein